MPKTTINEYSDTRCRKYKVWVPKNRYAAAPSPDSKLSKDVD
jgi:hypothetical protein